jgi:H+/Cl- antiporter ClcA
MNPTTVMIVCAVLIAAILLFILSQLPAKIREIRAEIAQRAPEQENKPTKDGTFKKFIYYIILGVILIGSGMGVSMLIVLMEDTFSFMNPAPIIWGVAAGIMLLFKPLVRKLLKMDK